MHTHKNGRSRHIFLQLNQEARFTCIDIQRVERLHLVELGCGEITLTQRIHAKIDKSESGSCTAEPAHERYDMLLIWHGMHCLLKSLLPTNPAVSFGKKLRATDTERPSAGPAPLRTPQSRISYWRSAGAVHSAACRKDGLAATPHHRRPPFDPWLHLE